MPFAVTGEPTLNLVPSGLVQARQELRDLVIGFGGGSAMDAGKAIAALLTNPGEPLDYLEVRVMPARLGQRSESELLALIEAGSYHRLE